MSYEMTQHATEEDFFNKCIELSETDDAVQKIYIRLCRDMLPVLLKVMSDHNEASLKLLKAMIMVNAAQIMTVANSIALPGREAHVAKTMVEYIGKAVDEALENQGKAGT